MVGFLARILGGKPIAAAPGKSALQVDQRDKVPPLVPAAAETLVSDNAETDLGAPEYLAPAFGKPWRGQQAADSAIVLSTDVSGNSSDFSTPSQQDNAGRHVTSEATCELLAETLLAAVELTVDAPHTVLSYLHWGVGGFGRVIISNQAPIDQIESFRALGGVIVLGDGWSTLEPWGVWSDGSRAVIYIKNPMGSGAGPTPVRTMIGIDAIGAISQSDPPLVTRLCLGTTTREVVFAWGDERASRIELQVPDELAMVPLFRLEIDIESPKSPRERTNGVSPDPRLLGIGVRAIELFAQDDGRGSLIRPGAPDAA